MDENKENIPPAQQQQQQEKKEEDEEKQEPGQKFVLVLGSPLPSPTWSESRSDAATEHEPRSLAGPEEVATYLGPSFECEIFRAEESQKVYRIRIVPALEIDKPSEFLLLVADVLCDFVSTVLDEYNQEIAVWMISRAKIGGANGTRANVDISTFISQLSEHSDIAASVIQMIAVLSEHYDSLANEAGRTKLFGLRRLDIEFLRL